MQTWLVLEADYGAPPERDSQAWKADPRAYLNVAEDCTADDCSVDQDKVLIECALGAKCGFYQFPRDRHSVRWSSSHHRHGERFSRRRDSSARLIWITWAEIRTELPWGLIWICRSRCSWKGRVYI